MEIIYQNNINLSVSVMETHTMFTVEVSKEFVNSIWYMI
jgi:hypothetical protein